MPDNLSQHRTQADWPESVRVNTGRVAASYKDFTGLRIETLDVFDQGLVQRMVKHNHIARPDGAKKEGDFIKLNN